MKELIKPAIVIGLAAAMFLVVGPMVEKHNEETNQAWQAAQEAAEDAYREPFVRAFASDDWQQILMHCQNATNDASSYFHPPQALAMAADRVDIYVYEGPRPDTLMRVTCSEAGLSEGRVDHPLKPLIPAERIDRESGNANLWGEMGMLLRTQSLPVASLELVVRPDNGQIVRRTTIRTDRGWQVQTAPPGSPNFALLSTGASMLAGQAELGEAGSDVAAAAAEYPRYQWSAASGDAFALLERELPEEIKASIAGLRFDDDEIRLVVAGPIPGFSFAYATIDYDAWGTLTNWLYPYDVPPSFGCAAGIPMAQVRQRFDDACEALSGCRPDSHFSIADYSCSTEGEGRWRLHLQP